MRKIYSLLLLCLMGTVVAWAEEATTIYERGTTTAWSSDDLADWTQSYCTDTIAGGLSVTTTNAGWTCTKEIKATNGTIVTLTATIHTGGAPGRSGSYDYVQIGGVSLRFNEQDKVASVDVDGTSTNLTLTYNRASDYNVEITIDQSSGNVSYTCGTVSGTASSSTAISNIIFGHYRAGKENYAVNTILKNIAVTEKEPEATSVNYTINYIFNSNTIKTVNAQNYANTSIKAENPITINNVKYYIADGETTSMTLGSDATANVLNVKLRLAGTQTVNINAVDADGNLLEVFSGTRVEGDAASNIYYTRVVLSGDEYYTVPAANGNGDNYAISMAYDSDDAEVVYTLNENIEYYAEESGLNISGSFRDQQQVANRASGGDWNHLAANSYLYTDALLGGEYTIDVSGRNHGGSTGTLDVQVLDANGYLIKTAGTMSWNQAVNAVQTVTKIIVPEGGAIAIAETAGYTSNIDIDYLIAYRTGDLAEDITVNSTGVSSYVTTFALDFSDVEGLTAMIATDETEDEIVMTKVTKVPAGTPIIVRGTPGETYTVPGGDCTELPDGLENRLSGSTTETFDVASVDNPVYALKNTDGDFHRVASTVTIPTGIAYLVSEYPNDALGAKKLTVFGEDDDAPTAVSSVVTNVEAQPVMFFNAAGQQVGEDSKGLVIGNDGKKMIK